MRRFYLGTHRLSWLPRTDVPLFVSAVQFRRRRTFPKAKGRRAFDSGGFMELRRHGRWTVGPRPYVGDIRRAVDGVGMPDFVAPQDWMCEPIILAETGKTIAEHQARTIESVVELRAIAPEVPWMPVLQGWECDDYLDHIQQYAVAGIDLAAEPIVGVGTICKRQSSRKAARIIRAIALHRIRIHAFGVKADGIRLFGDWIESADSMAWSYVARRRPILLGDDGSPPGPCAAAGKHKNCANCLLWALEWRQTRIVDQAPPPAQTELELAEAG